MNKQKTTIMDNIHFCMCIATCYEEATLIDSKEKYIIQIGANKIVLTNIILKYVYEQCISRCCGNTSDGEDLFIHHIKELIGANL